MRNLIIIFLLLACGTIQAQVDSSEIQPEVFDVVERMPEFPGGEQELMKFLRNSINYPENEKSKNIQGRVIVKFTVTPSGKVINPRILKSASAGLDKEALRVVKLLPDFKPGMQQGRAVYVYYNLPIVFAIAGGFHKAEGKTDYFTPDIISDKEFEKGQELLESDKWKDAIEKFENTIKNFPNNYEGYLCKGVALVRLGKNKEACKYFEIAAEKGSQTAQIEKKNNCN